MYVLRPLDAAVWLYSDDALLGFDCASSANNENLLYEVCSFFVEFGQYTGLCLNLSKTKALLQGVGPWLAVLSVVTVVSSVKYPGALFSDVAPGAAFDKAVASFEHRCTLISRMPLSMAEKVQIIYTWCHPVLKVTAVAYYPPPGVLVRSRAALQRACGCPLTL